MSPQVYDTLMSAFEELLDMTDNKILDLRDSLSDWEKLHDKLVEYGTRLEKSFRDGEDDISLSALKDYLDLESKRLSGEQ